MYINYRFENNPNKIKELEKVFNTKFQKVEEHKIMYPTTGKISKYFVGENGSITGLNITNFDLKSIPTIISSLEDLTYLSLSNIKLGIFHHLGD